MALWATKRRLEYGGAFIAIVVSLLGFISWQLFYVPPTCMDGSKNGDEKGIDCGGSCKKLCTSDALNPAILWSKIFNISGEVYSAVAYVENPNINSKNVRATYQFRIYDENHELIIIREGETRIPKGKKFVVFEPGIVLKNAKPESTEFQFLSFSEWEKDLAVEPDLTVTYGTILGSTTAPYLEGKIINNSLETVPEVELSVLVLDDKENVIGASKTFVDNLRGNTSQDFVFTWQRPFDRDISVIQVVHYSF